jgi:hypothetical protein
MSERRRRSEQDEENIDSDSRLGEVESDKEYLK